MAQHKIWQKIKIKKQGSWDQQEEVFEGIIFVPKVINIMRIKLNAKPRPNTDMNALWRNSPCSFNYLLTNTSTDQTRRFEYGSIYYKDQVDKPKKVFNQFEKPDLLRSDFVRQIEEASHPKYYSASKKNAQKYEKEKNKTRTLSLTNSVTSKLYTIPMKNDYQYDRGGYRSHIIGDYDVKEIQSKVLQSKRNFSSGRRTDLGRPLNFFPGPGTYEHDKKSSINQAPQTMRTCIGFRKQSSRAHDIPQTERRQKHKSIQAH